uniref:Uncharacterized protein n=1 Tax=Panagrolaimus superbus TaxID=310955 RepID=A0A914YUH2_9BILA
MAFISEIPCILLLFSIFVLNSSAQQYMRPAMEVDKIETVDVTPSQIIITTTKVGPVESLHIYVDVIDIEKGEHQPAMNLSGLLLLITRGRYTVNFLRPGTWYGVAFYSEQKPLGDHGQTYLNFEEKLVRTLPSPEISADSEEEALKVPPMEVTTRRMNEKGKSIENLLVALKWTLPRKYRTNLQAVANISLHCKDHIRYKELKLADEESEKSVEVKLDNSFNITENRNSSREIVANIQPKNCHRICWDTSLMASFDQHHFGHAISSDCRNIEPVTAKANIREYLSYDVNHGDLIIRTNATDTNEMEDAIVDIKAIELPEGAKNDSNATQISQVFGTNSSDPTFVLHDLNPQKWYAVEYIYLKRSPFNYVESRRFIVESRASTAKPPFRVRFITKDPKNNSTSSNSTETVVRPRILMVMDPGYKDAEIGIDVDPFCNAKGPNSSQHFWINARNPQHELKGLNILGAVCGEKPEHSLCGGKKDDSSHDVPGVTNRTTCNSPNLCYTGNLKIHEKVYSMKRRCLKKPNKRPKLLHLIQFFHSPLFH